MFCPHCQSPMPSSARWTVQFRLHVDCRSCGARSYLDYQRAMRRPSWPILVFLVPLVLALVLADTFFPSIPGAMLGLVAILAFVLLEVFFNAGHVSITAVDKSKGLRRRQQVGSILLLLFWVLMFIPVRTYMPWIPAFVILGLEVFALAASGYYLLSATRPGGAGE